MDLEGGRDFVGDVPPPSMWTVEAKRMREGEGFSSSSSSSSSVTSSDSAKMGFQLVREKFLIRGLVAYRLSTSMSGALGTSQESTKSSSGSSAGSFGFVELEFDVLWDSVSVARGAGWMGGCDVGR